VKKFTVLLLLIGLTSVVHAADVIHLDKVAPGGFIEAAAGPQLIIDTSGLTISEESELIVLQLFSDYYATPYKPETTRYTLNVATLKSFDSPPFKGLSAGDSVYLMIGKEPSPGALKSGMFLPEVTWYLRVE
jgi:hypothetical protein